MKIIFILFISFITLSAGCSTTKDTTNKKDMRIVKAVYESWSQPPPAGSDIPENGSNLRVTVQNWPDSYTVKSVIYKKRKSVSARIAERIQNNAVIKAHIVRMSSYFREKSEKVEVSDRLVYTTSDGESGFIEIEKWEWFEE